MSERQEECNANTLAGNYPLHMGTIKICRDFAENEREWRSVARATLHEIEMAAANLGIGKVTVKEIEQSIADECGKKQKTVDTWKGLEFNYGEWLDEVPVGVLFSYDALQYIGGIAKKQGKEKQVIFWELVDEAIAKRDRLNDPLGENVLVTSCAVLNHRAHGDGEEKETPVLRNLRAAANHLAQAHKNEQGNGFAPLSGDTARAERIVARIFDKARALLDGKIEHARVANAKIGGNGKVKK